MLLEYFLALLRYGEKILQEQVWWKLPWFFFRISHPAIKSGIYRRVDRRRLYTDLKADVGMKCCAEGQTTESLPSSTFDR
jgi:hypothetical protein